MVVRLQIAEGKIKEYRTTYKIDGENNPANYFTKCGKMWIHKPKPQDECDHLDCAIYLAKPEKMD